MPNGKWKSYGQMKVVRIFKVLVYLSQYICHNFCELYSIFG